MRIVLTNDDVKVAIAFYLSATTKTTFSPEDIKDLLFVTLFDSVSGEQLEFRFTELKVVLNEAR